MRTAEALVAAGDGPYAAGLLVGHLDALEAQPDITPVWTGPHSTFGHGRLTLAVVADLIDEAAREIVLVSYATVPGRSVRDALTAAVERGVAVTLLLPSLDCNEIVGGRLAPPGGSDRRSAPKGDPFRFSGRRGRMVLPRCPRNRRSAVIRRGLLYTLDVCRGSSCTSLMSRSSA